MDYLETLCGIINGLENYYDHPATVQEDHNDRPVGIEYNGDPVDIDEQIHFCEKQIEDRQRYLAAYKGQLEIIQRQRNLDLQYPTPED